MTAAPDYGAAAARTGVFTLSVDLDLWEPGDADDAMQQIADAITRRCIDLPHTRSDVQVDVMEVQVSSVLDRSL